MKSNEQFALGHFNLGLAYSAQGNFDQALAELQTTLKLDPKQTGALLNLAIIYQQKGDDANAILSCEAALKLEPKNSLAHSILSNIYISKKAFDKAAEEVGLITAEADEFRQARLQLIEHYKTSGTNPREPMANLNLATMYLFQNWNDQVISECQKALQLNPDNLIVYNTLVAAYSRKQDFDNAGETLKKMIELEPNFTPAYISLGNISREKQLYDDAIAQYKTALKVNPKSFAAQSSLAVTYQAAGKKEDAIKEYKQLIAQLPQTPAPSAAVVYNDLAWLYAEDSNKLDEALSFAQKANELAPRSGDVLDTLGWVHFKRGIYKEAIDKFKAAVIFTPNQPTIHYHLGMAYYKTDQKEEALKELNKALTINPNFPEAASAKEIIDQLTKPPKS